MVQENGRPTAEEKGKGKAAPNDAPNGDKKSEELRKGKDGKPIDGKKDGEPGLPEGMVLRYKRRATS